MSACPKCGRKLRLTDWRPNCPGCGVNLMFYGFEERFYEDAKRAELSKAGMRVKTKRAKASFKGSLPAKLRLAACALPLLSLFLSMGTLRAALPFADKQWPAGLLDLINAVMGGLGDLPWLKSMLWSDQAAVFRPGLLMLAAAALAAAIGLLVLLGSIFSFISLKKMAALVGAASVLGALASAGGFIAGVLLQQNSITLDSPVFSGSLGFGAPIVFTMFALTAALNFLLCKKGVPVEYGEGDYERAEIYKRVKRGEISLDDLPFPVVETAATRERAALIEKEIGGAQA